MRDTKPLEAAGLSEREARVYLGALELGQGTVQEIAAKCAEKRVTTHVILTELEKKGLVRFVRSGRHRIIEANNPDSLLPLVREQEHAARINEETVRRALPDLSLIYTLTNARPTVRFYEGAEGIRTLRRESWHTKADEVVGFVTLDQLPAVFGTSEREFSMERVRHGIRSRVIYTSKKGSREDATNPKLLREARFVSPKQFPFESDVSVYGDTVSLVSMTGKLSGVVVTSQSIANTMRAIFELAWIGADKKGYRK